MRVTEADNTEFAPDPSRPLALLGACPVYAETSLSMKDLGASVPVLVKEESERMRLGSFKAVGGTYAVAQMIHDAWVEAGNDPLSPEEFTSDAVKDFASNMTFMCASAGNHGLSVAAGANIFGAKARIHLSEEVPEGFAERLRGIGAEVVRSGPTYETSLDAANKDGKETDALLLADGSWPGYTYRPSLVMEGYTVIAEEMREAFERGDQPWPTHVFLQAGVGGLATGIAYMVRKNWSVQPEIIIVEPDRAPCLKNSHEAGKIVHAPGPVSNMGRLDCKDPSLVAFHALEKCAVSYATVTDEEADVAVAKLKDYGINSTPSGTAGYTALLKADLPSDAKPLVIISEGAV
jgi:diaminopropionate ammonia-lyase